MVKKKMITLMINENVADFIVGMLNISDKEEIAKMMVKLKIRDDAMGFLAELADAIHDAEWCKDSDCIHEKII